METMKIWNFSKWNPEKLKSGEIEIRRNWSPEELKSGLPKIRRRNFTNQRKWNITTRETKFWKQDKLKFWEPVKLKHVKLMKGLDSCHTTHAGWPHISCENQCPTSVWEGGSPWKTTPYPEETTRLTKIEEIKTLPLTSKASCISITITWFWSWRNYVKKVLDFFLISLQVTFLILLRSH